MKLAQFALSVFLIASASVCTAQDPGTGNEAQVVGLDRAEYEKTIRTRYANSQQLPDGIAFVTTLRQIKILNDEDPTTAEAAVISRLRVDLGSAQKIIASMLTALEEHDVEVRNLTEAMGCDHGVPRLAGEQVFSLMESIDDANDELATEHLVVFLEKLDAETADVFQQWLQQRKRNVVHVNFNHKELAKVAGKTNVDAEMSALCSELWQQ